jgi:hypothetical protein
MKPKDKATDYGREELQASIERFLPAAATGLRGMAPPSGY